MSKQTSKAAVATQTKVSRKGTHDEKGSRLIDEAEYARERTYHKATEIQTDVFKLTPAVKLQHEGPQNEDAHPETHQGEFIKLEHCHIFRTYDKFGKRLGMSVPIGGHFHLIEWEPSTKKGENAIIKKISPPMVMGVRKINGRKMSIPVPMNSYDFHTHGIEFQRTDKIMVGKANAEAAQVAANVEALTAKLDGVQS